MLAMTSPNLHPRHGTIVALSILWLSASSALANPVSPGEKALTDKLPKALRSLTQVQTEPLLEAAKEAVAQNRGLAPQITGAAVRRAENCDAVEKLVRMALHRLQPTPTPLEVFAITQSAVGSAANNFSTTHCTEAIVTAALAEYPQYASTLNDSGKQVAGKDFAGKQSYFGDQGDSQPNLPPDEAGEPHLVMPPFPIAVTLPGYNRFPNPPITPTY
jgi:hypothetical protein